MALVSYLINLTIALHTFYNQIKTSILTFLGSVVIVKRNDSNYLLDTFYYYVLPHKLNLSNSLVTAHIHLPEYSFTAFLRSVTPCSDIQDIIKDASSAPAPKRKNVSLYLGQEQVSQDLGRLDRYYRHCRSNSVTNLFKVTQLLGMPCDRIVVTEIALPRIKTVEHSPEQLEINEIFH